MTLQVRRRHRERIDMHRDRRLTMIERRLHQGPDFFHRAIGHRIAADRDAVAMHHEKAAGSPFRPVEGVRIAEIEGQVEARGGVHLARRDRIEALRRLQVALRLLRAELARISAHGPRAERFVHALFIGHIGRHHRRFLGKPKVNGIAERKPLGGQRIGQFRGAGLDRGA